MDCLYTNNPQTKIAAKRVLLRQFFYRERTETSAVEEITTQENQEAIIETEEIPTVIVMEEVQLP
jgi:hypothetical protein